MFNAEIKLLYCIVLNTKGFHGRQNQVKVTKFFYLVIECHKVNTGIGCKVKFSLQLFSHFQGILYENCK